MSTSNKQINTLVQYPDTDMARYSIKLAQRALADTQTRNMMDLEDEFALEIELTEQQVNDERTQKEAANLRAEEERRQKEEERRQKEEERRQKEESNLRAEDERRQKEEERRQKEEERCQKLIAQRNAALKFRDLGMDDKEIASILQIPEAEVEKLFD